MKTRYETTIYESEKCIARIHRPILTDEERKVREEAVRKAIIEVYKERVKEN